MALRGLGPRRARSLLRATIKNSLARRSTAFLAQPLVVLLLFNGSFVGWHVPSFYQAAMRNPLLHELEHASFLATAMLFWWVLIDPVPRRHRLSTSTALLVLFASWMISDLLGATLALAREPLYPLYADTPNPWGLTAQTDQYVGGLIMWAGGAGLYGVLMIGILAYPHACRHTGSSMRGARPPNFQLMEAADGEP